MMEEPANTQKLYDMCTNEGVRALPSAHQRREAAEWEAFWCAFLYNHMDSTPGQIEESCYVIQSERYERMCESDSRKTSTKDVLDFIRAPTLCARDGSVMRTNIFVGEKMCSLASLPGVQVELRAERKDNPLITTYGFHAK
jgi:hypothetical protein